MSDKRFHYKDRDPKETITIIEKQLRKLNLTVHEDWIESGISDIFSLRVTIDSLNVRTFGKGCTKDFAKASAYAELIERLSNFILLDPYLYKRFSDFPDSKELAIKDYYTTDVQLWGQNEQIINQINNLYNKNRDTVYSLPFTNIITKEKYWFPAFFFPFVSSNGMGAGNSYEELAVQAISEIFERYCIRKIFESDVTVPIIELEKLSKTYPLLLKIQKEIELMGNKVLVRDCNVGTGFPVYCVVILKQDNTFSIAFGSHPNFEYAIERCFTEALQGSNINKLKNERLRVETIDYYNMIGVFANGIGIYPDKLFEEDLYSEDYDKYLISYDSNIDMYSFYLELIKKNNMNFYYYDNSYLGLYSGHFFSPNVSDVFKPTSDIPFRLISERKRLDFLFENFEVGSYQDQISFVKLYDYCLRFNIDIKNKEFDSIYKLESLQNLILFLGVKALSLGELKQGIKYLNWIVKNINNEMICEEIKKIIKDPSDIDRIKTSPLYTMKIKERISKNEEKNELFEKLILLKKRSLIS